MSIDLKEYTVYGKTYSIEELRKGYEVITGIAYDDMNCYDKPLSENEIYVYLLDALAEAPVDKFRAAVLSDLVKQGLDVSQIDLEIQQFIDDEHKSCLWYGGPVATIEYKNHVFWLEAHGDVSCSLLNENGDEILSVRDKGNSGEFFRVFGNEIDNDTELVCLEEEGKLVFSNNNWFEVFVETPDGEKHDLMDVCSSDDLEECIFEMVEDMDRVIARMELAKDGQSRLDALIESAEERKGAVGVRGTDVPVQQPER